MFADARGEAAAQRCLDHSRAAVQTPGPNRQGAAAQKRRSGVNKERGEDDSVAGGGTRVARSAPFLSDAGPRKKPSPFAMAWTGAQRSGMAQFVLATVLATGRTAWTERGSGQETMRVARGREASERGAEGESAVAPRSRDGLSCGMRGGKEDDGNAHRSNSRRACDAKVGSLRVLRSRCGVTVCTNGDSA